MIGKRKASKSKILSAKSPRSEEILKRAYFQQVKEVGQEERKEGQEGLH